jgi:hypothetical protein
LQDVDICLLANERKHPVMYYGKDSYFFHDESLTFNSPGETKYNPQMQSDEALFQVLWGHKIRQLVL